MKKRILFGVALLFVAFCVAAFDSRMVVRCYELDAAAVETPVRIVLVTDLHSCYYGEGQKTLIDALEAQTPDLVLLGGDIFDDKMDDINTEQFLAGIAGKYPCYYVTGNHEYWSSAEKFAAKMAILEKYGVTILSGRCETIEVNGETISLCGVDDPDSYMLSDIIAPPGHTSAGNENVSMFEQQLDIVREQSNNGNFTILLSHRPEWFESYVQRGFDLVLCGHAHGGQWRIPGMLNGLYAPNQGLFPQYAGGWYEVDGTVMVVSRGLARESTRVPRIFNRPELVVVEIQ